MKNGLQTASNAIRSDVSDGGQNQISTLATAMSALTQ
jgi:hypothetical protein